MEYPEDDIIIGALLKRFTEQRLPEALKIEKKVLAGKTLNESDITFLDVVMHDAKYILRYSDRNPEYQKIVTKALKLYADITDKAVENEKNSKK